MGTVVPSHWLDQSGCRASRTSGHADQTPCMPIGRTHGLRPPQYAAAAHLQRRRAQPPPQPPLRHRLRHSPRPMRAGLRRMAATITRCAGAPISPSGRRRRPRGFPAISSNAASAPDFSRRRSCANRAGTRSTSASFFSTPARGSNCTAPEIAAITHFWSRITPGGFTVLDDYAYSGYEEQYEAFNEFAAARGGRDRLAPDRSGPSDQAARLIRRRRRVRRVRALSCRPAAHASCERTPQSSCGPWRARTVAPPLRSGNSS